MIHLYIITGKTTPVKTLAHYRQTTTVISRLDLFKNLVWHLLPFFLCRRLYGKYLSVKSPELEKRLDEMKDRKYDKEYQDLMNMDKDTLKKKYYARDIE